MILKFCTRWAREIRQWIHYQGRMKNVSHRYWVILNGFVRDRDPILMSSFWSELVIPTSGNTIEDEFNISSKNRWLDRGLKQRAQTYLRCFTSEQPQQWEKWLCWAESWYNSSHHTAVEMSPFEAVYGRPSPTLHQFFPGGNKGRCCSSGVDHSRWIVKTTIL